MTKEFLECIEIESQSPCHASIIWLHGLGADGHDFAALAHELKLPSNQGVRFIFPHAPLMPVTINNGYVMRAWYDIHGLGHDAKIDHEGIDRSKAKIGELIAKEITRGIPPDRIIVAGFSQGAVIALACGLTYSKPLAGIIALSGYLPYHDHELVVNHPLPIFIGHGLYDDVIPCQYSEIAQKQLADRKCSVTFRAYPIAHTVCVEEITDVREWVMTVLPG